MPPWVVYVAAFVVLVIVAGKATDQGAAPPQVAATPTELPGIGLQAGFDPTTHMSIVVTSFKRDKGGEFSRPDAGTTFAIAHVVITNYGTESQDYNDLYFYAKGLVDLQRYRGGASDSTVNKSELDFGKLAPGETVAGDVAVQIPLASQNYDFFWTPNLWADAIPVPYEPQ